MGGCQKANFATAAARWTTAWFGRGRKPCPAVSVHHQPYGPRDFLRRGDLDKPYSAVPRRHIAALCRCVFRLDLVPMPAHHVIDADFRHNLFTDPFAAIRKDSFIYGRGAQDDKDS